MPRKYSGILRTLCSPSIFRTLVHSKPWHIQKKTYAEPWNIQNRGIFRTLGYSELDTNSESYQKSTMERCAKVINS